MKTIVPTLLIVDDERLNLNTLVELFQETHNVLVAKDGKQALLRAAGDPRPDLILLDILMPDIDGFETCRRLKENPLTAGIPIIFLTALQEETDQVRGFELGAVDFITKPFMPSVVRARVKTHLALNAAHALLESQNSALIKAAQLKEDVDRIMRHDLKGPLNSMIGFSQVLMDELTLDEDQQKMMQVIERSGYRMLRMINHSLDLYKMETGSYLHTPETVDLAAIVRRMRLEASRAAQAKNLEIVLLMDGKVDSGQGIFNVAGEETLCHALLDNLALNAMDAAPPDGTISIFLDGAACNPTIRVHNLGAVPREIRGRFFEKYVTAGKSSGTGLGTYSAQLMVKIMGGTIAMETDEIRGTTITVQLPKAL